MATTKRKAVRARGRQRVGSAVQSVRSSGYDLVPTRKSTGKIATARDFAKIKWNPWKREQSGKLYPDVEQMAAMGNGARLAYAIMLQSRAELCGIHSKIEHDLADKMMAELKSTEENLKALAAMVEQAYIRVLASACAHQLNGGKFLMDGKLQRTRQ